MPLLEGKQVILVGPSGALAGALEAALQREGCHLVRHAGPGRSVARTIQKFKPKFGHLHVAINLFAPPIVLQSALPMSPRALADGNAAVADLLLAMRAEVGRLLETGGGTVLNVLGSAGHPGPVAAPAYDVALHAAEGLGLAFAQEFTRNLVYTRSAYVGELPGSRRDEADEWIDAPRSRPPTLDAVASSLVTMVVGSAPLLSGQGIRLG